MDVRTGLVWALGAFIAVTAGSAAHADEVCRVDSRGYLICEDGGGSGGGSGGGGGGPGSEPPPLRYLRSAVDPVVGTCWLWAASPPGLDSWDPANDAAIIAFRLAFPQCPGSPAGPSGPSIPDTAWSVFRSFPLAAPQVTMEPPDAGITGLATILSVAQVAPIDHAEVLPNGRLLEVRAHVTQVGVQWGDGAAGTYELGDARPYPAGTVSHTYTTRTCTAAQRSQSPVGDTCHPSLDAYPVRVVFTWTGSYRYGGGWVELGGLDRAASLAYDVDEVVGVLNP